MGKHAYLIIAHKNFDQVGKLLQTLDFEENDIFLHIDKKSKSVPWEALRKNVKKSKLFFAQRHSIYWGHSSQVKCEIALLQCAVAERKYEYIHLISGMDFPLEKQEKIHEFFDKNSGKQFLQVDENDNVIDRIDKFHFRRIRFPEKAMHYMEIIANHCCHNRCARKLNQCGCTKLVKTSNWFSITGSCAEYLVKQHKKIRSFVRFTSCADEVFLGTFLYSSPFWNSVYKPMDSGDGHMRYIDWSNCGASPKILTMDDLDKLMNSSMLFARKFDESIDADVIECIVKKVIC